ncbi:MAG: hypothetical protein MJ153_01975 [Clostridia bacterium]|nr:hypothetical protein [Clostridia bacterium]
MAENKEENNVNDIEECPIHTSFTSYKNVGDEGSNGSGAGKHTYFKGMSVGFYGETDDYRAVIPALVFFDTIFIIIGIALISTGASHDENILIILGVFIIGIAIYYFVSQCIKHRGTWKKQREYVKAQRLRKN